MLQTTTEDMTNQIIEKALGLPGVKINRRDFLVQTFGEKIDDDDIPSLLKAGPVKSGLISQKHLRDIATKVCDQNRRNSSIASFASGLPGGLALAATIPLDTLQFFATNLRVAQQVAYIYGYDDFWNGEELNKEKVNDELTMFLGVMFDVTGASQLTKLVTSQLTKKFSTDLHQKALLKVVYSPVVRSIAQSVSIHVTRGSFSQGVSKTIPLLGGILSGGLTYSTMTKMNQRLCDTFDEMYHYTEIDAENDIDTLKRRMPATFDVDFEEKQTKKSQADKAEAEINLMNNNVSNTEIEDAEIESISSCDLES